MKLLIAIMLMPSLAQAAAPTTRAASFHKTITKSIGYDYHLQLPADYDKDAKRQFPLLIFLHGSGECGHDVLRVAAKALPRIAATQPSFPFILVAPQSPSEKDGWSIESLDALLDHVLATYAVDADRIYLTGLSMGGYGVWDWACHRPSAFAAVAPIAGEGNTDFAADLRHVPVWAFHGAEDSEVSPIEERRMVDAVNKAGGSAKLTLYPGVGHNAWSRAYGDQALFDWFLSHKRAVPAKP